MSHNCDAANVRRSYL